MFYSYIGAFQLLQHHFRSSNLLILFIPSGSEIIFLFLFGFLPWFFLNLIICVNLKKVFVMYKEKLLNFIITSICVAAFLLPVLGEWEEVAPNGFSTHIVLWVRISVTALLLPLPVVQRAGALQFLCSWSLVSSGFCLTTKKNKSHRHQRPEGEQGRETEKSLSRGRRDLPTGGLSSGILWTGKDRECADRSVCRFGKSPIQKEKEPIWDSVKNQSGAEMKAWLATNQGDGVTFHSMQMKMCLVANHRKIGILKTGGR